MKIIVTGGSGAIGNALVKFLTRITNYEIISFGYQSSNLQLDITNSDSVEFIVKQHKPDYIFNLAAVSNLPESFEFPIFYHRVNCTGVLYFLEAIRKHSPNTKFLNAGTIYELNNNTPYSGSKISAATYIKSFRESYKSWAVQPLLSNILVGRDSNQFVVPKIINYYKKKDFSVPLELGNIFIKKKWLDISDLVSGLWRVITQDVPHDVILSGEEQVNVKEIVKIAAKTIGIDADWKIINDRHVFTDGNVIFAVSNSDFYRKNESVIDYNIDKTKQLIGWEPEISVRESIEKMIQEE